MAPFLTSDDFTSAIDSILVSPFEGPYIQPRLSWDLIKKREALLAGHDGLRRPIPAEFPESVSSPSVLAPQDIHLVEVTYELGLRDIEELERALKSFQSKKSST